MEKNSSDPFGVEQMMQTWTRSMTDAMGMMSQFWKPPQQTAPPSDKQEGTGGANTFTAMTDAFRHWQTIASAMATPESISSFYKGTGTMPEMSMKFGQAVMTSLMEFQRKMGQSAGRMGESVEAYQFEQLDENLFRVWTEIYEKEFRKFFHVPQLGLTREYQERFNAMLDNFHLFQANHGEFLRLLSLPFQRSVSVVQEKVAELAEKGELPDDFNVYYQMWLKVLEGHFMTLFQTPEFMEALANTLNSLASFSESKDKVMEDILQGLPIAQQSELDDLARQVHDLKRKIRRLEKANSK